MKKFGEAFPQSRFSADHVSGTGVLQSNEPKKLTEQIKFIREQGYEVQLSAELSRKRQHHEIFRIAVAFFCLANVMIFACAEYFSEPGEIPEGLFKFFRWSSAILAGVSLIYSGSAILKSGYRSLKSLRPSVDASISFALITAYIFSLFSLFDTSLSPFFDSIAATVFLIILGRFFQAKFIENTTRSVLRDKWQMAAFVFRMNGGKREKIESSQIVAGDRLLILPGDVVPVESRLLMDEADFSFGLISGESEAVHLRKNEKISAGAVSLAIPVFVEAMEDGLHTKLKKIRQESFELSIQKLSMINSTEKIASYFYLLIMSLAVMCFAYSYHLGLTTSISRVVALLLVACPCAFAVAVPLAMLRGAYEGHLRGVLFKNASAIERLAHCKVAVFDKTGTLTEDRLKIDAFEQDDNRMADIKVVLLSGLMQSRHAAARALFDFLNTEDLSFADGVTIEEHFGKGLIISHAGRTFLVGNKAHCSVANENFDLFVSKKDGQVVAKYRLAEKEVSSLEQSFQQLQALGLKVAILSGDRTMNVEKFAHRFGIAEFRAETSPDEKKEYLDTLEPAMMIGNGFNDALAMSRAHIGISVAGSNPTAIEAADVHLIGDDLRALPAVYALSRQTVRQVKQAFLFSAFYNLCAASLAFAGFLTPVVAAVIMPINGIVVSLISSRRLKV